MSQIEAALGRKLAGAGSISYATQCEGKLQHATLAEAQRSAKVMHKRYHKQFDAYQCRHCDLYHVGTRRSQAAIDRRKAGL